MFGRNTGPDPNDDRKKLPPFKEKGFTFFTVEEPQVKSYFAETKDRLRMSNPQPHDPICQWCSQNREVVHQGSSMEDAPVRRTYRCRCDGPDTNTGLPDLQ